MRAPSSRVDAWRKAGGSLGARLRKRRKDKRLYPYMGNSGAEGISWSAMASLAAFVALVWWWVDAANDSLSTMWRISASPTPYAGMDATMPAMLSDGVPGSMLTPRVRLSPTPSPSPSATIGALYTLSPAESTSEATEWGQYDGQATVQALLTQRALLMATQAVYSFPTARPQPSPTAGAGSAVYAFPTAAAPAAVRPTVYVPPPVQITAPDVFLLPTPFRPLPTVAIPTLPPVTVIVVVTATLPPVPTVLPTDIPTDIPLDTPTIAPTALPTLVPTLSAIDTPTVTADGAIDGLGAADGGS